VDDDQDGMNTPFLNVNRVDGVLFFAGSCNPKPGANARYGFVLLYDTGRRLEHVGFVGLGTNNSAELHGLIAGMEAACCEGVTHTWRFVVAARWQSAVSVPIAKANQRARWQTSEPRHGSFVVDSLRPLSTGSRLRRTLKLVLLRAGSK
jgi:ribonuclease HI